jgi:hypothetical protein
LPLKYVNSRQDQIDKHGYFGNIHGASKCGCVKDRPMMKVMPIARKPRKAQPNRRRVSSTSTRMQRSSWKWPCRASLPVSLIFSNYNECTQAALLIVPNHKINQKPIADAGIQLWEPLQSGTQFWNSFRPYEVSFTRHHFFFLKTLL